MATVGHSRIRVTDVTGQTHTGEGAGMGEAVGHLEARWLVTPAGQSYLARRAEPRIRELEARVARLEATVEDLEAEVVQLLAQLFGPRPEGGRP
jgi:hypothetical protein